MVKIEGEEIAKVNAIIQAVLAETVLHAQKRVKDELGVVIVVEVNWRLAMPEET